MTTPKIGARSHYIVGTVLLTALLTWLAWNTNAPRMGYVLTNPSDPLGYYQWLPGTFIGHDWSALPYVHYLPNGKGLSLFTMGVAIMQAPFYLLATLYCKAAGITATGYELPFVFARLCAAAFYCSTGLALTLSVLRRYYSIAVAWITCLLLLFGTNLYFYTVHDGGMSHVYSFLLFAYLLRLTVSIVEQPSGPLLLELFFCGALIILVRPLNGVVLLVPLLYGKPLIPALKERVGWVRRYPRWIVLGTGLAVLILLPQLLYWRSQTGHYLVFTYGTKDEGFNWASPHLWDVLFSHQGGWLLYHPLMVIAMVTLIRGAWKKLPNSLDWRVILLVWCIVWYLYASWWNWWLGGSFGHRGFVEHYALLSLALAACIGFIGQRAGRWKWSLVLPGAFLIYLNIRMSLLAFSPMDGPTWTWDSLIKMWGDAFFV